MTNIAYFIYAFKQPERVARLINRVQTGSDFIYVHFDTMIGKDRFNEWKRFIEQSCPNKTLEVVSKFRCKWGSIGSVEATLTAMEYFENFDYDYFTSLTGDCYPIKSPSEIKKELKGQETAFMEFFKLPYKGWWRGGMERLNKKYYFLPRLGYPYVRIANVPRLKKGLPYGLEPYGGHGGAFLPKRHVGYIVKFVKENPAVRKFYRRAFAPDEMFFETILLNSPLKESVVNDCKRYVVFDPGQSHPKILTMADFEDLKKSGKFFARKFNAEVDANILDAIDQEIDETLEKTVDKIRRTAS